jgi:hypothetical protein
MTKSQREELSEAIGAFESAVRTLKAHAEEAAVCARDLPREARKSLTIKHWQLAPVVLLNPAREG